LEDRFYMLPASVQPSVLLPSRALLLLLLLQVNMG
jgi:hypothetical protein